MVKIYNYIILEALRGILEYIARYANNIARVEDEGNNVSIEGNVFQYPPKKSHPILLLLFIYVCHHSYYLTIVCNFHIKSRQYISKLILIEVFEILWMILL